MDIKPDYLLSNTLSDQKGCPIIKVGIMDNQQKVSINLKGLFLLDGITNITGIFTAKVAHDNIYLFDEQRNIVHSASDIRFINQGGYTFTLSNVTIGIDFHWEKKEIQSFRGDLILKKRLDNTIAVINEIALEEYLESVISSEMNSSAPVEFLKTHAIISRSWLISALEQKKGVEEVVGNSLQKQEGENNTVIRWYEQEGHDIYHVCADDHCQRYQGITKISTENPLKAVKETYGVVITYGGEVCDARYSKACGGITEEYRSAWKDMDIPYLKSISDAERPFQPLVKEEDVRPWVLSKPKAYCNIDDMDTLKIILPDSDLETHGFFRWRVTYTRPELEDIIKRRSGYDLGTLKAIKPLKRGPSGRIYLLNITGSEKTLTIGKELEIRRWLSNTHLLSSAFIVETEGNSYGEIERFTFYGAGWGHGVGLCQIGAGVMAIKGYNAEAILRHYFPGTQLEKIY